MMILMMMVMVMIIIIIIIIIGALRAPALQAPVNLEKW